MRQILLSDSDAFHFNADGVPFLLLGEKETTQPFYKIQMVDPKLAGTIQEEIPGLWGTLGMADDSAIDWEGFITCSGQGNDDSKGLTLREIKNLYHYNPQLDGTKTKVLERFIDLDHVIFRNFPKSFKADDLPYLRLTLFLPPEKGALVYCQHYEIGDDKEAKGGIEYIHPKATENHTLQRDRLTYLIPIIPHELLKEDPEDPERILMSGTPQPQRFVIKVLTYARPGIDSYAVVKEQLGRIEKHERKSLLKKPYGFCRYDLASRKFKSIAAEDIDTAARTLLLIHGTFASTHGSFGPLIDTDYEYQGDTWMEWLLTSAASPYEQIIGFDRPTVFDGVQENAQHFFDMLGSNTDFQHPVDVLTTSVGGLLAKYLAGQRKDSAHYIPVGKVATCACSNGVGYLSPKFIRHFNMFFSMIRMLNPAASMAAHIAQLLAQHSVDYLVQLNGLKVQTPGSPELEEILALKPQEDVIFLPIVGDYNPKLLRKASHLLTPIVGIGDWIVKRILGHYHDWVVGSKEQYIMPDAHYAFGWQPANYEKHLNVAGHLSYLKKLESRGKLIHDVPEQLHAYFTGGTPPLPIPENQPA